MIRALVPLLIWNLLLVAHHEGVAQEIPRPSYTLTFDDAALRPSANVQRVPGVVGRGVRVDGATQFPIDAAIPHFARQRGSLAMWVMPIGWHSADQRNHYFLIASNADNTRRLYVQQASGPDPLLGVFAQAQPPAYGDVWVKDGTWQDGQWRLLVITWDDDQLAFYLDGNEQAASATTVPPWWNASFERVWLGGHVHGEASGATAIDELRVFDEALTPAQVQALYEQDLERSPQLRHRAQTWEPMADGNIADLEHRVTVIASSKTRQPEQAAEMVIDGDAATGWQSAPDYDALPLWVELSWPAPVQIEAVRALESWKAPAEAYRIEVWDAQAWRTVASVDHRRQGGPIEHAFEPCRTTKVRLVVTALQGDPSSAFYRLHEFEVKGQADRLRQAREPGWQAHYIWTDTPNDSDVDRFFAKPFDVTRVEDVAKAWLQISADDAFVATLNGQPVGRGSIAAQVFEVTPQLREGANLLAIEAHESGGDEGVIAELLIVRKDGAVQVVNTDTDWFAATERPTGWPTMDLPAGSWPKVRDQGVPPHSTLHPDVAYRSLKPRQRIEVETWSLDHATVRPGESTKLSLALRTDEALDGDFDFLVRLGDAVDAPNSDYTIARYRHTPDIASSRWKPGDLHSIEVELYLPEWAPHGPTPIQITAVSSQRMADVEFPQGEAPQVFVQRFDDWKLRQPVIPQVELMPAEGRVQLKINGEIVPPIIWGSPEFRTFRANGTYATFDYPIWRVWMSADDFYPPDDVDWDAHMDRLLAGWDQHIRNVLRSDPRPYLLIGFSFRPRDAWTKAHPDEATLLGDGTRIRHSFASPLWMEQSKRAIRRVVQHLMQADYRGHVIGINFGVGEGPETYYWGMSKNPWDTPRDALVLGDHSPRYIEHFRRWLRDAYDNDVTALQEAWRRPDVTFDNAVVDVAVLRAQDHFAFRDPLKSRMAYDYWRHHAELMADAVIELGQTIDDASGGRYIKGLWGFYSAGDNVADGAFFTGKPHHVAYAALQKVLESSAIDFLAGIQSYMGVGWNEPMTTTNITDSITAHGKLWVTEFDTRPFYATLDVNHHTWSERETLTVLKRNVAAGVVNNWAVWFQGFPGGTEGRQSVPWFGHEALAPQMRDFRRIYDAAVKHPSPSEAEVVVFVNNDDLYALDLQLAHDVLVNAQVNTWHVEMPKVAAAYDYFNLPDVVLPHMGRYKLYVFLNAYNITQEQRERIKDLVRRAGKTALWLYLPGYVSMDDGLTAAGVEDLTGFHVTLEERAMMPAIVIDEKARRHALVGALPDDYRLSPRSYRWAPTARPYAIGPLVAIEDPAATVLGRYEHDGRPALAVKKVGQGRSVFVATPYIDAPLLRSVCQFAGVHLYTSKPIYVDSSRHWLSLQTGSEGFAGTIKLPHPLAVHDMYDNNVIAPTPVDALSLTLPPHSVRLYFLGSGEDVSALPR